MANGAAKQRKEKAKMTLYELREETKELLWMLEDDPENEAIKDTIQMVLLDLGEKAEDYVHVIRQLEADAEQAKNEAQRLMKKAKTAENGADRLREALKEAMLLTGQTKIKRPTCSMSVSSREKAIITADPKDLPEEFQKVTVEAKKADITKWLKAGNEADWAHLESTVSLTIR